MATKINIEQILTQISAINAATNNWSEDIAIPQIEIDILKTKLQKLYELINLTEEHQPTTTELENNLEEVVEENTPLPNIEEIEEEEIEEEEEEITFDSEEIKRLHYIKVLFNGDASYYAEQMQIMAELPTFEEVLIHISENFAWSQTDEAAQLFVDSLARRF